MFSTLNYASVNAIDRGARIINGRVEEASIEVIEEAGRSTQEDGEQSSDPVPVDSSTNHTIKPSANSKSPIDILLELTGSSSKTDKPSIEQILITAGVGILTRVGLSIMTVSAIRKKNRK